MAFTYFHVVIDTWFQQQVCWPENVTFLKCFGIPMRPFDSTLLLKSHNKSCETRNLDFFGLFSSSNSSFSSKTRTRWLTYSLSYATGRATFKSWITLPWKTFFKFLFFNKHVCIEILCYYRDEPRFDFWKLIFSGSSNRGSRSITRELASKIAR